MLTGTAPLQSDLVARADEVLASLAQGRRVAGRTVVVCAHPDDETLGLGGVLDLFDELELIQLTAGAPDDPADRRAAGCDSQAAYAALREQEFDAAMEALEVVPTRIRFGLTDQRLVEALVPLATQLAERLDGAARVFVHAYEGGHPDHDAAAFAVQAACGLIDRKGGQAPLRLEFAGYHQEGGRRVGMAFWPDEERPETGVELSTPAHARKAAALEAYASQRATIDWFPTRVERFRAAPSYDFTRPPPPGEVLYDGFGWSLTSGRWRIHAAAARAELGGVEI